MKIKQSKQKNKYNSTISVLGIIVSLLIVLMCFIKDTSLFLTSTFVVWSFGAIYSFYKSDYYLSAFFAAFFIFLLGGEILVSLGVIDKAYNFTDQVNFHAYKSILISLAFIFIGYYFLNFIKNKSSISNKTKRGVLVNKEFINLLRKITLIIFFISLLLSTLLMIENITIVFNNGFLSSYGRGESIFPKFIVAIAGLLDISYFLFLSTMPKKKTFYIVSSFYFLYSSLTLLTFKRMYFFINYMLIFVYTICRDKFSGNYIEGTDYKVPDEQWTNFKSISMLILSFVIIIPVMNGINNIRFNKEYESVVSIDNIETNSKPKDLEMKNINKEQIRPNEGWNEVDGNEKFILDNKFITGIIKFEDKIYYLGDDGNKKYGIHNISGGEYYFPESENGAMYKGFININGEIFYFGDKGYKEIGLKKINNKEYLFLPEDGKMAIGIVDISGEKYLFGKNGSKQYGWQEIADKEYFFSPEDNGKLTKTREKVEDNINEYIGFANSQGFSINVIKWGYINKDLIHNSNYTFGNVIDYFMYGSFASKFRGNSYDWYNKGNSIEMATLSHRYAHAISYAVFPEYYLTGRGVGSSFIAEAYHDYDYIGIAFISLIVGLLLRLLYKDLNIIRLFLGYLFFRSFMFMPRSSFDTFILEMLSLKHIFFVVLVIALTYLFSELRYKNESYI